MRGATRRIKPRRHQNEISTHAPHAGSDLPLIRFVGFHGQFQPTLPMRGATFLLRFKRSLAIDFNPRSPCGERLSRARRGCGQRGYFNPRSPCGERPTNATNYTNNSTFQPTLPMRGATLMRPSHRLALTNFNPRSPCGERLQHIVLLTISLPDIVKSHSRKQKRAS